MHRHTDRALLRRRAADVNSDLALAICLPSTYTFIMHSTEHFSSYINDCITEGLLSNLIKCLFQLALKKKKARGKNQIVNQPRHVFLKESQPVCLL